MKDTSIHLTLGKQSWKSSQSSRTTSVQTPCLKKEAEGLRDAAVVVKNTLFPQRSQDWFPSTHMVAHNYLLTPIPRGIMPSSRLYEYCKGVVHRWTCRQAPTENKWIIKMFSINVISNQERQLMLTCYSFTYTHTNIYKTYTQRRLRFAWSDQILKTKTKIKNFHLEVICWAGKAKMFKPSLINWVQFPDPTWSKDENSLLQLITL